MYRKQAEEKGYSSTGYYNRIKERLQEDLNNNFKSKGYKAIIVTIPDSKLSRGPIGTGYSIFAEEKYFTDREKEDLINKLNRIPGEKEYYFQEYQKEIRKIEEEETRIKERLQKLEKKEG